MTAFAHFFAAAHADLAVWGIASCCCSVLLLLTCWWLPDVRRTPGWQFLYSSLYEIYCSAGAPGQPLAAWPSETCADLLPRACRRVCGRRAHP
eukprot:scaffold1141_cov128-Isochrysis_galbana.AAC.20